MKIRVLVMKIINLYLIMNAIMNALMINIQYGQILIYVQKHIQIIIILIMIKYTKNVIIHVKHAINLEMKQIIIVMNA